MVMLVATALSHHIREMKLLTHEQARAVYDRIGAKQDTQAFYEDVATTEILRHANFADAAAVFEVGCGTGRFANELLSHHLGPAAKYRGIDVSTKMIELATARIAGFADRATVALSDGSPRFTEPAGSFDRVVSNFVLDLLGEDDIRSVIAEAYRLLDPGGLLCLTSLSGGHGVFSRIVIGVWSRIHALNPSLVGGCRPVDLASFLAADSWQIRHHARLTPFGLPSEAVIAERLA